MERSNLHKETFFFIQKLEVLQARKTLELDAGGALSQSVVWFLDSVPLDPARHSNVCSYIGFSANDDIYNAVKTLLHKRYELV